MSDLQKNVLEEIERRRLKPRPYAYFLAKRSIFWALSFLSILLGAICVAVAIFAVTDFQRTGGRGFDEMPFDDMAQSLPILWFVCLSLFVGSAYLSFVNTKRGHRFPPALVITAVLAASLTFGFILHGFEVGRRTHRFLAAKIPAYEAFTTIPYDDWRRPDQGFLGGEALSVEGKTLRLRDFDGLEWTVDISAAVVSFSETLVEEGDVAIRGERTGPASFKADFIDEFD